MPPDDVCTACCRPQVRHSPQAPPSGEACRSGKSFYLYRPISDRHGSGFHLGEVRLRAGHSILFPARSGHGEAKGAAIIENQCLKWRSPVNTMAIPFSSAFRIESSSRTEPPGCTMAVTPYSAASVTQSSKGKKPSEASTSPFGNAGGMRLPECDLGRADAVHLPGRPRPAYGRP